jgi:hypothetical protein
LTKPLRIAGYVILGAGLLLVVVAILGASGRLPTAPLPVTAAPPQHTTAASVASATPVPPPTATTTHISRPTEPLLPTRTRATVTEPTPLVWTATATPRATQASPVKGTVTAASSPTLRAPSATPTAQPPAPLPDGDFVVPASERFRLGIAGVVSAKSAPALSALQAGWVMNWQVSASPAVPPGVMYAQTVLVTGGKVRPPADTLRAVAAARPGSLWLIGNEPDVPWQDGITAERYAVLYHEAYHAIRDGDPGARVAPGGIAQTTPLRLRYLDEVLAVYQERFGEPLPAQAWQIHNYMLREERGSWGVGIPPGMPDATGMLYNIEDSGNLELFEGHIYAFRRWMAERGYRGLPLYVTEFSNPMPEDYGFPPESRAAFLRETWRFFLTATDGELGDPSDGGRLVQRWCWFSLYDTLYPAENLVEADYQTWTPLGRAWLQYINALP